MDDPAFGHVPTGPPGVARAAKSNFLVIHEKVFIEKPDIMENLSTNHHAGTGDPIGLVGDITHRRGNHV